MRRRPNPRAGVFTGFWLDENGARVRKVHREEWAELYRLWRSHSDIRLGVRPLGMRGPW